jgi:hypothetical protein
MASSPTDYSSMMIYHTNWGPSDGGYNYPRISKSGDQLTIDYGDGTIETFTGGNNHSYSNTNIKAVKLSSSDGWSGLTEIYLNWSHCSGDLLNPSNYINLQTYVCDNNLFTGGIPSFSTATGLLTVHIEYNLLSGVLPSFANCVSMTYFNVGNNSTTGYIRNGFSTQASLSEIYMTANQWPQAEVDAILAEFVTSLSLPGRVACTVGLNGAGMSPPSSSTNHDILEAAGWTVNIN